MDIDVEAERRWLMVLVQLERDRQYLADLAEAKRLRNRRGRYQ